MQLTLTQQATVLESDLETPVGQFIRLVGDRPGILCESAEVDGRWGRYSIIAHDFLLIASCREGLLHLDIADEKLQPLRFCEGLPYDEGLRALMKAITLEGDSGLTLPPITRGLFGYLGYGVSGIFEPKLASVLSPADAVACMGLPKETILCDHVYNRTIRLATTLNGQNLKSLPSVPHGKGDTPPTPLERYPLAGKEGYTAAVNKAKELIRKGEAIQVVLSTPFGVPLSESPFSLYRRLRRINPSSYMFYMRLPEGVLIGSSPEVMVTCAQDRLRLCPIAGTRPRSKDADQDIMFGEELQQDPKEQAEHVMLVDLGRNDLGRIARFGTVRLERYMEVERFSHVMHLTSRISADLESGLDAIDVLRATFPAGTVSGAPKIRAMEIIAEAEQTPRGLYAGAGGWIGLDKDSVNLDFGIIIRSMWVQGGQVRWQSGAGIVFDSDPDREWQECLNKAMAMRRVITGED